MSKLTKYKKDILYPAAFEVLDKILPEMEFSFYNDCWRSPHKLGGKPASTRRPDKTVANLYEGSIYIKEWDESATGMELTNYLVEYHNIEDDIFVLLHHIFTFVPEDVITPPQRKTFKRYTEEETHNFTLVEICKEALEDHNQTQEYLLEQRGWPQKLVDKKLVGYLPPKEEAIALLKEKGLDDQQVEDVLRPILSRQYDSLFIPFFNTDTTYAGCQTRSLKEKEHTFSSEFQKIYFNLRGKTNNKNLYITESPLDALLLEHYGFRDAIALGGNRLLSKAALPLHRYEKVFLLLDVDTDYKSSYRAVINLRKKLDHPEVLVCRFPKILPETKIDVGQLYTGDYEFEKDSIFEEKPQGEIGLKEVISKSRFFELWYMKLIPTVVDYTNDLQRDKAHHEVKDVFTSIRSPKIRNLVLAHFELVTFRRIGIDEQILMQALEEAKFEENLFKKYQILKNTEHSLTQAMTSGNYKGINDALKKAGESIEEADLAYSEGEHYNGLSLEEVKDAKRNKPQVLSTGILVQNKAFGSKDKHPYFELNAAPGGVLCIAAPTGSGKTAGMLNAVNNILKRDSEPKIVYYNTEGPVINIYDRLLNICSNVYSDLELSKDLLDNAAIQCTTLEEDVTNEEALNNFILHGKLPQRIIDNEKEKEFAGAIQQWEAWINDKRFVVVQANGWTATKVAASIRQKKKDTGCDIFFVDYLQKLPDQKGGFEMSPIEIERAAIDTNSYVIIGSQMNREVSNPARMEATKMALTSRVEQSASEVVGLYYSKRYTLISAKDTSDLGAISKDYGNWETLQEKPFILVNYLKTRLGETPFPATGLIGFDRTSGKFFKYIEGEDLNQDDPADVFTF